MNNSSNRYFAKKTEDGTFTDITTLFDGVAILKMEGFLAVGKPVNIYTAQWIDEQEEDFLIPTVDDNDNKIVIHENVDVEITFIVRQKYANGTINVQQVHDAFATYMTNGDVYLKSSYTGGLSAHCVCLSEYKPTTVKLGRGGDKNYIMGTITLHTLEKAHS